MNTEKTQYRIAAAFKDVDNFIVQSLQNCYDYTEFKTVGAAWESEKTQAWVIEYADELGEEDTAKTEFLDSLTEYTPQEVLSAALHGYGWPIYLGFVEEVEESETDSAY